MCLAIFKPPGLAVPDKNLEMGWQTNSGGAGFAYVRSGKVHVSKGFMKLKEFLPALEAAQNKNKKSPFLIHFRIPSMGSRGEENTHPFEFKHGALIHNGTIYGTGAVNGQGPSDTAKFAEKYGDKLTFDVVKANKKAIGEALGYNKVAILYHDGSHHILNEADGFTQDGVWYSNSHFIPYSYRGGNAT